MQLLGFQSGRVTTRRFSCTMRLEAAHQPPGPGHGSRGLPAHWVHVTSFRMQWHWLWRRGGGQEPVPTHRFGSSSRSPPRISPTIRREREAEGVVERLTETERSGCATVGADLPAHTRAWDPVDDDLVALDSPRNKVRTSVSKVPMASSRGSPRTASASAWSSRQTWPQRPRCSIQPGPSRAEQVRTLAGSNIPAHPCLPRGVDLQWRRDHHGGG